LVNSGTIDGPDDGDRLASKISHSDRHFGIAKKPVQSVPQRDLELLDRESSYVHSPNQRQAYGTALIDRESLARYLVAFENPNGDLIIWAHHIRLSVLFCVFRYRGLRGQSLGPHPPTLAHREDK
jgi:hypothetical protein